MKYQRYYTFYNELTDEILCFGTAEELVEKGAFTSFGALRSVVSKIKHGKSPRRAVVIEKIKVKK